MTTEELAELMQERAFGYRFLARAFRTAPDGPFVASILESAEALGPESPLAPFFEEARAGDREQLRIDLAADYNQLFLGMSAHPLAPYESVYTSEEGLLMQDARDAAVRAYRTWGLRVPASFDLPEDHVALELELMAYLAERAATTAAEGRQATEFVIASRAFLEEHLGWVARLCDDIEKSARTAFYFGVAGLTREYLEADRETLAAL